MTYEGLSIVPHRHYRSWAVALSAALLSIGAASPALAQQAEEEVTGPLPKLPPPPAAQAAMQGIWKITTPMPMLKPLSGPVPFTVEGRKRYEANRKLKAAGKYDDYDITTSRCSHPGVPRAMLTPRRFKIWFQFNVATFDFEWNRALRYVDLRGIARKQALVPDMQGTAVGHWEGDTLVVTTTDVSERTLIDDLTPHTVDMKVTERFRLVDPDTLEDRMTIDDPLIFTHPWDSVVTYRRQPFAVFPEDVCLDHPAPHHFSAAS